MEFSTGGEKGSAQLSLTLLTLCLWVYTGAFAEQRSDLKTTPNPQVLCSICEESDLTGGGACRPRTVENYCKCRQTSQPTTRVLYRDNSSQPLVDFKTYEPRRLKALRTRLLLKRQSNATVKKAVSALKKRLKADHQAYLARCLPTPVTPTGDFTLLREVPGFRIYTLSDTRSSSFALGITDGGAIIGGTYPPLPMNASNLKESSATGLPFVLERSTRITPIVWTKNEARPACTNCPPGLILSGLNDRGQAVGTLRGTPPTALEFNYKNNTLQTLPSISGAAACAGTVNESGMVLGTLNCRLGQPESQGSDVVVWINGVAHNIDRDSILRAYEDAWKPAVLGRIKKDLAFPGSECSPADIESTHLIGRPVYDGNVDILATDVNDSGDAVGIVLSPEIFWEYDSACFPKSDIPRPKHVFYPPSVTFLRTSLGMVDIRIDRAAPDWFSKDEPTPMTISDTRVVIGFVKPNGLGFRPARFDFSNPDAKWDMVSVPELAAGDAVIVGAANEKNDFVGMIFRSGNVSDGKGFAVIGGKFVDLNALLGSRSDLTVRIATGINSCGQIVGRVIHSKTGVSQAVLFSPPGCPKAKS